MGRLFWKFFLVFWLAQFLVSAGVGTAMWLLRPEYGPPPPGMDRPGPPPPAGFGGRAGPPPPGGFPGDPGRHPPGGPGGPREPGGPGGLSLLRPPLLPILVGSLASVLFAALVAWYFSRPIRSLRGAFEAVAGGRLETRVAAAMGRRHDELADLGSDFDRMAERLQGLIDSQRRLLHDVSHELRSPLARLQAAADLMRQQPERAGEFVERIERDTARMDRLVGELLTLARLDAGMAGDLDDAVDLAELLYDIATDARFEAAAKHAQIALDVTSQSRVRGRADLLHRALENVVRNAVRHSPEGGRIAIRVREDGAQVSIAVEDEGAGVAVRDLDAIFDPFFRGAGTASAGYGLGLAITRRIIEAHGGAVTAANRPAGGLVVTAVLLRA